MKLVFDGLVSGYGDTMVLRGVSGSVAAGEVLAVVGRNGVGKSTLLKTLAGQLPLIKGAVDWGGTPLAGMPLHGRLGLGIAYAPQDNVVFGELSVADNLWLHLGDRDKARYQALFEQFPLLEKRLNQRAGSLSGGERKLLSFSRTLGLASRLSMLDEPTEGVQPENIDRMATLVNQQKNAGASFIIVEQNLEFVAAIADSVLVMDHGEAVLAGPFSEVGRIRIEEHMAV